jgi:enediyne biosynthesis protein E4
MKFRLLITAQIVIVCLLTGCSSNEEKKFRLVPSNESGITFRNTLKESVDFNIFNYMYFYNGAGVGVGDFNSDGLIDVYLSSNQEPNKLYLNQGDFKFRDVTEISGVEGFDGWATGVAVADVNADGRLDIYVGYIGQYLIYNGKNQLFINEGNDENGIPVFKDKALDYGLDLVGFSTQAAFFDYDRDGDLDMYMLNHSLHQNGTFGKSELRKESHPLAGDKLLRNDNGHFVDVTLTSGIYNSVIGYGLGVTVSDVNLDGWPDIYVGNDFHENDYLYINQGDGTFKETIEQSMRHTSRYTMGVDFADFNNDAFPDLIAMDMLPSDPEILKASQAEDAYDVYNFKLNFGFNHQFARNVLQINNQNGTFSDIALLAGVAATDWSWSTLFADFDLDGHKDIFVSNGIMRRSNDLDYINFITVDSIQMKLTHEMGEKELTYISKMPQIKIPNALFINNQDSTFSNRAGDWGLEQPSYSNGTAYADFDNDGDLDLVVNNLEDEAFLYENLTIKPKEVTKHFLQVQFKGEAGNTFGLGTKVFIHSQGKLQMQECMPIRGYQSSVDNKLTFGLGASAQVDSLIVVWTNGNFQKLTNLTGDKLYTLNQADASGSFNYSSFHKTNSIFSKNQDQLGINYIHQENTFVEFNREQLIPHMVSREGPAVAIADITGDGLDDLFLGGGKWQPSQFYRQTIKGNFIRWPQPEMKKDSTYEDVDAVFFDEDKDGDQDIFVVSGGNEFSGDSKYVQPRLYKNDGKGNFSNSDGLPAIFLAGACASINDVDQDGDLDIFLGARTTTWHYGVRPDSYMLINDGKGNFSDQTDDIAPALRKFGFVKQAIWADVTGDSVRDLVIAGEWMPITILVNENGKLAPLPTQGSGLENTNGWWNTVTASDIDLDGDLDLIAGNLGLNSKLHASIDQPVNMYESDFDKNDQTDQVLTHFMNGKEYPFHTRDEMTKQMPFLKKRFLSYHTFAKATVHDLFDKDALAKAEKFTVQEFKSGVFINLGNSKFKFEPLPKSAQFSTVNAILVDDFNNDKTPDILLAGNFYPINIQMGRNDASYGLLLTNNGKGKFKAIPANQSGFSVKGEVRHVRKINLNGKAFYLAVRNDDTVEVFEINR